MSTRPGEIVGTVVKQEGGRLIAYIEPEDAPLRQGDRLAITVTRTVEQLAADREYAAEIGAEYEAMLPPSPAEEKIVDLMQALMDSVNEAKAARVRRLAERATRGVS